MRISLNQPSGADMRCFHKLVFFIYKSHQKLRVNPIQILARLVKMSPQPALRTGGWRHSGIQYHFKVISVDCLQSLGRN